MARGRPLNMLARAGNCSGPGIFLHYFIWYHLIWYDLIITWSIVWSMRWCRLSCLLQALPRTVEVPTPLGRQQVGILRIQMGPHGCPESWVNSVAFQLSLVIVLHILKGPEGSRFRIQPTRLKCSLPHGGHCRTKCCTSRGLFGWGFVMLFVQLLPQCDIVQWQELGR